MYTRKRDSQDEILVCQLGADNGSEHEASYVQLNVFYNINDFFGFLTKRGIKMEKLPDKIEERKKLFLGEGEFEINENRVSHFFSGAYEANSCRKEYVEKVKSDVISEVKRVSDTICKTLFDLKNINCSYLVRCVDEYLNEELYIENAAIESLGYYQEVSNYFSRNSKSLNYDVQNRVRFFLNNDVYDGISRVIIALMLGSHVCDCFELLFPDNVLKNVKIFSIDETILLVECWNSNFEPHKEIRTKVEKYKNINGDSVAADYILGMISSNDETGTQSKTRYYLDRVIEKLDDFTTVSVTEREFCNRILGDSYYELFRIADSIYDKEKYIFKSANYGHSIACCICGDCYSKNLDSEYLSFIDESNIITNFDKAIGFYLKAKSGYGYYLAAKSMEKTGKIEYESKKVELLIRAYKCGYDKAYDELIKYEKKNDYEQLYATLKEDVIVDNDNVCIVIGACEENMLFLKSLPKQEQWGLIFVDCERNDVYEEDYLNIHYEKDIIHALNSTWLLNFSVDSNGVKKILNKQGKVIIVELGEKSEVDYTGQVFDYVGYICNKYDSLGEKYFVEKHFQYFVNLPQEIMELHIDCLQKKLGNHYIPLFNCNYRDTVSKTLLFKYPLIAPLMDEKNIKTRYIINILGVNEINVEILKNILAIGVLEDTDIPIRINVIGENTSFMEANIIKKCGDVQKNNKLCNIEINYYDINFESVEFSRMLEENNTTGELGNILKSFDYMVCNVGNDFENIEMASRINMYNLRYSENLLNQPYICVRCKSGKLGNELIGKTMLNNSILNYAWYESPSFKLFGDKESVYSYEKNSIENNVMLKWALSIHYSYYDKGCDEHEIWNDYYSSSYGRDSSEMAAIFILYRMYAARCFGFESWDYEEMLAELHDYTLVDRYREFLSDPLNKEKHSEMEHIRWNRYMISRGWMPTSYDKMKLFIEKSKGKLRQKFPSAKMHRYIATWEELGNCPGDQMLFYLNYIKYSIKKNSQSGEEKNIYDDLLTGVHRMIDEISCKESMDAEYQRGIVELLTTKYERLKKKSASEDVMNVLKNAINYLRANDDTVYTGIQKEMVDLLDKTKILPIKQIDRSIVGDMPGIIDRARQICWGRDGLVVENVELEDDYERGL